MNIQVSLVTLALLPRSSTHVSTSPLTLTKKKKKANSTSGSSCCDQSWTCSVPVPGSTFYVHACHPCGALPAPGLAGCPVGRDE